MAYFVLLTFIISIVIGWLAIPRIVIIAKAKRLFDSHDARKVHAGSIPRLGGLSFFPGAMLAFSMVLGLRYYLGFLLPLDIERVFLPELMFFNAGMFLLFFVGLADDLVGVSFRGKFVAQIFAASLLTLGGLTINSLDGLFGVWDMSIVVAAVVTVLFIVFAINSFNLIDGVDGLCSGTSTIVLTALGSWFMYLGDYVYAMLAFSMVGVVIVFFLYNVLGSRLKIFMGDTGSLTLGYMIVFLGLKFLDFSSVNYPEIVALKSPIALLAGLVFLPLFDTLRVFVGRISKGHSPFHPDKTHIHHKLLRLGLTHLQSTASLLFVTIFYFGLNIVLSQFAALSFMWVLVIDFAVAIFGDVFIELSIKSREKRMCVVNAKRK